MPFITARNACYYDCDKMLSNRPQEPDKYIPLIKSETMMKAQIHGDIEVKRAPDMTPKDRQVKAMKESQARKELIKPLIETIKEELKPQIDPRVTIAPVAHPAISAAEQDEKGKGITEMTKTTMKNNTKNIIQRIMDKEKKKTKKIGMGNKMGSGIKQL